MLRLGAATDPTRGAIAQQRRRTSRSLGNGQLPHQGKDGWPGLVEGDEFGLADGQDGSILVGGPLLDLVICKGAARNRNATSGALFQKVLRDLVQVEGRPVVAHHAGDVE